MSAMVVAQQAPGVVTGTVLDQNGNPVTNFAGGIIQVTNPANGAVFKTPVAEKSGEFQFAALPDNKAASGLLNAS